MRGFPTNENDVERVRFSLVDPLFVLRKSQLHFHADLRQWMKVCVYLATTGYVHNGDEGTKYDRGWMQ